MEPSSVIENPKMNENEQNRRQEKYKKKTGNNSI